MSSPMVGRWRVKLFADTFTMAARIRPVATENGDARLIIIHSPAGFERFFRATAAATNSGEFDIAFRDRLAAESGVTYHDDITV